MAQELNVMIYCLQRPESHHHGEQATSTYYASENDDFTHIVEGTNQHKNYSSGAEDRWAEDQSLVEHVYTRDVVIQFHRSLPGEQKVKYVSHSGRSPSTSLVEELVECLRGIGQSVSGSNILYTISLQREYDNRLVTHRRNLLALQGCNIIKTFERMMLQ